MQHRRHKRGRSSILKCIRSIAAFLIATALLLLGIKLFGDQYPMTSGVDEVGSLAGRFGAVSTNTRTYNGRDWVYRDRALTNILIIGSDWDADREGGSSWRYDGQADFLLLLTLDSEKETVQAIQIDRDTMSDIRIYGPLGDYTGQQTAQLCLSYAYGDSTAENCENVVWAVSNFLGGVPVDAYMVLDMKSMAIINDAMGGVTVTLEDDFSHLDPAMTKGRTICLQGDQVEIFLRSRMTVGEGTNASRMHRQRVYLEEAANLFSRLVSEDLNFVSDLFDQLSGHLTTNAERGWLINRAYEGGAYTMRRIRTIAGRHQVNDRGFMEFWADEDALDELIVSYYYE